MTTAIICAMQEEMQPLYEILQLSETKIIGSHEFHLGKIEDHDVILTTSGIGKVAAAITATVAISVLGAKRLINTGSAGWVSLKDASIGEIVVADKLAYNDVNLTNFGYEMGELPDCPRFFITDEFLADAAFGCQQVKSHRGTIVSGDAFVCTKEQSDKIRTDFPEALACEMEGAAIAQTAFKFNIPFVVIRSISDGANSGSTVTFNEFLPIAAKNAAAVTKHVLAKI